MEPCKQDYIYLMEPCKQDYIKSYWSLVNSHIKSYWSLVKVGLCFPAFWIFNLLLQYMSSLKAQQILENIF